MSSSIIPISAPTTSLAPFPLDSELLEIEKVIKEIEKKQHTNQDIEMFHQEIKDRFHKIGWDVVVRVWTTDSLGTYAFDIELNDRVVRQTEFDVEKMQWEVVNDIAELDPGMKGIKIPFKKDLPS
jgi:hypothetical protein